MRHGWTPHLDPGPGVAIATLAWEYALDATVTEHSHGSDQLIYATRGMMEVTVGRSCWLIPPQFAVWIPAHTAHRLQMSGVVFMRTLYLRPRLSPRLPTSCTVLQVTPLLRELVLEATRIGMLRVKNRLHRALRDLIVERLQEAPSVSTGITLPTDTRALNVARAYMADQPGGTSLRALCDRVGVSVRTIERAFRKDVGLSFEGWRRQVRLVKAIELLAGGSSVKAAAFDVGYRQPSTFVHMFRQTLGVTPRAWAAAFARDRDDGQRRAGRNRTAPTSRIRRAAN
ncbi:MAG TPA: helix-turn-helix transcriptional regulator [Vicinamibacterales bacterium]|nr:helix-turn-helix transcriptional regulator [Vicinamibacterales bacterium]